jgi:hypothetical protein
MDNKIVLVILAIFLPPGLCISEGRRRYAPLYQYRIVFI